MLSLGAAGAFDSQNIMSPAVVKEGGKYFMYYAGGPMVRDAEGHMARYQLSLALSDDGEKWKKTGKPLLPLGARDNFHVSPALLRDPEGHLLKRDGVWHMVYCANRADDIDLAHSRDGLVWQKDPRSPVYKKAYAPALLAVDGELRMYYTAKPVAANGRARPWEIHLATGKDIYSLKSHSANPVLTLSQDWEERAVLYPYVIREGKTWVMFYASYWKTTPQPRRCVALGMATSPDGIAWIKIKANPVLTPNADSRYDSQFCSSPCVIGDGDHYRLYYAARMSVENQYYAIGLATLMGTLLVLVGSLGGFHPPPGFARVRWWV